MFDNRESTFQVDRDHVVPLFFGHVENHSVAEDPRAGHNDVQPPVVVHGGLDDALASGHSDNRLQACGCRAAGLLDLRHHRLGDGLVGPGTVHVDPWVNHHDLGPFLGHQLGYPPADTPAGAGHDGHLVFEHVYHNGLLGLYLEIVCLISPMAV